MEAFTSSFHHAVSLHGGAPPLDLPSIYLATLLMQLAILFHVVLGSSWAFQSASYTTRFIKTLWLPFFGLHHLILEFNLHLIILNLFLIEHLKLRVYIGLLHSHSVLPYNPCNYFYLLS